MDLHLLHYLTGDHNLHFFPSLLLVSRKKMLHSKQWAHLTNRDIHFKIAGFVLQLPQKKGCNSGQVT